MKSKKAKSVKKSEKDWRKKLRKELRGNLASGFMTVVKELGHSSDRARKLIRKTSRKMAREIEAAMDHPMEEKKLTEKAGSPASGSKVLKPVAKKELVRARKVVARAGSRKTPAAGLTTSAGVSEDNPTGTPGERPVPSIPVTRMTPDDPSGGDPVSPS